MKTRSKLLISSAFIALAAIAYAATVTCPIDKGGMYFTGKTTTEMGKLLYQYKCPNGHTTWVVK